MQQRGRLGDHHTHSPRPHEARADNRNPGEKKNAEAAPSKVTPAITGRGEARMCHAAAVRPGEVCTELRLLLQKRRKPKPGVDGGVWVLCGAVTSPSALVP